MADDIDIVSDINNGELDAGGSPQIAPPAGTVPAQGTDTVSKNAQPQPAPQANKTSLRDTLSSAFKGEDGKPVDQAASHSNTGEQPRAADGKFAPKPKDSTDTTGQQQPGTETGAAQPVQAPAGLDPQAQQHFAALPPEMQQFVARTLASAESTAAQHRGYEQLEQLIAPRRQAWAMNGMSETNAIQQLFALSDFATRAPADFVKYFASQNGVDLTQLAQGGQQQEIDPVVQEITDLRNRLDGITNGQAKEAHNAIVSQIQQFATEVDDKGQPLRPHFAEVANGVAPLVAQLKTANPTLSHREILTQAYDQACWANPTVRAKLLAAQDAARLEANRVAAERAANAGSSVSSEAPRNGSAVQNIPGTGSVRDTLRGAFAQYH